ncbi:MAG: hypothetical protein QM729_21125 [Solirubrobacterales bacterium]
MPGSPYPQAEIRKILDRAIQQQETESALSWAKGLKKVGLDQALDITLLLAHDDDPRYPKAARRFLARFIVEVEPKLLQLKKVVDAMDCVERVRYFPDITDEANRALEDLARQLRRRGDARDR